MATATPVRVTDAPRLAGSGAAMQLLREGLANAISELDVATQMQVDSDDPAVWAWERMVDEAVVEVAPDVAAMVEAAIAKRLPWTWEPER